MSSIDLDALLARVIEATPTEVELNFVDYDDQLTREQIQSAVSGDEVAVWNDANFMDWESDQQWDSIMFLLAEALPDEKEREAFRDTKQFDVWRDLVHERDRSDPYGDLLRRTGRRMFEFDLGLDVETNYTSSVAEQREMAQAIARAAGIPYRINKDKLRELVIEASYGGRLHVLIHADTEDVVRGVNADGHIHRAIFTDPTLIVHDRMNGSGHDVRIKGVVKVDLLPDVVRLDEGRYSWSDDIAGVVHSYYETEMRIVPTRRKKPE